MSDFSYTYAWSPSSPNYIKGITTNHVYEVNDLRNRPNSPIRDFCLSLIDQAETAFELIINSDGLDGIIVHFIEEPV